MESEDPPQLPTSGQILGVLAKSIGLNDPRLRSKNAQRYFSGRMEYQVKESSRSEIIQAISDSLAELGFGVRPQTGEATSASVLPSILRLAHGPLGQDEDLPSTQNASSVPQPSRRRLAGVPKTFRHRFGFESRSPPAHDGSVSDRAGPPRLDKRKPAGSLPEREAQECKDILDEPRRVGGGKRKRSGGLGVPRRPTIRREPCEDRESAGFEWRSLGE